MLIPGLILSACTEKAEDNSTQVKTTYTCPMHPQIVRDKPGTCPICGMDLVVFDRTNKDESITLTESQIALANITTATIGDTAIQNIKNLNARLVINPEKTVYVASRVPGRIDELQIKETGVKVSRGQPLYRIYSEELAGLQQEYLISVAQTKEFPKDQRFREIAEAARQKLILYGQSNAQIDDLAKGQKVLPYVTYNSPANGVVAELSVTEGQYVAEGGAIMKIENYDELWVEADLYVSEASVVKVGQAVKVLVAGWEGSPQEMKIQFINPNLQNETQLLQVRGTVKNPTNQWQPGMQANVILPLTKASQGLSVPTGAIIRDGKGDHIWVEIEKGKFVPKMVKIGTQNAEMAEIIEGIEKGDKVVVSGAYLLYSEYILKKGTNPLATHKH